MQGTRDKNKTGDRKGESNDSPEIPETHNIIKTSQASIWRARERLRERERGFKQKIIRDKINIQRIVTSYSYFWREKKKRKKERERDHTFSVQQSECTL